MKNLLSLLLFASLLLLSSCKEVDHNPPTKPELVSPDNLASDTERNLVFNWKASTDAMSYTLQISLSPEFAVIEYTAPDIDVLSHAVNDLKWDTHYYWRVNAKNNEGTSPWSDVWEFTTKAVGVPRLIAPTIALNVVKQEQKLEWGSVTDATGYNLEVSLDPAFSSTLISEDNVTNLNFTLTDLEWNEKYYWRVNASVNATKSDWSEVWNFTTNLPIPSDNLVAYYPFNGNAHDESTNSHNGIVNGPTLANDRNGKASSAYLFDGIDDYIKVPHDDALNLIGNFTISVWYKSDGCATACDPPAYHTIIMKRDVSVGPGDDWPWGVSISYINGGSGTEFKKLYSTRRSNGNADYLWTESQIQINTWQHAVFIVQDNVQSIYIDGVLDSSGTFTLTPPSNTKDMQIGWSLRTGLEQFKGQIDDIRLYSRALTSLEVLGLYLE
jgi:hypothetical protein